MQQHIRNFILVASIIAGAFPFGKASFAEGADANPVCAEAKTNIEKAICASAETSKLDRELSAVFQAKRNAASADKQAEFDAEQSNWMLRREWQCHLGGFPKQVVSAPQLTCLNNLYADRIADLKGQHKDFDPDDVRLLFSADSDICEPVRKLYDELSHTYEFEFAPVLERTHMNWEEYYAARFDAIGLKKPSPSETLRSNAGDWLLRAYYRLSLWPGGEQRIVFLNDYPRGSNGDFGTGIFLLKADVKPEIASLDEDLSGVKTAAKSDLALFPPVHEQTPPPEVHMPYKFREGLGQNLEPLNLGDLVIQRLFKVGDRVLFTVRTGFDGSVMVYQIDSNHQVQEICDLISNDLLRALQARSNRK